MRADGLESYTGLRSSGKVELSVSDLASHKRVDKYEGTFWQLSTGHILETVGTET